MSDKNETKIVIDTNIFLDFYRTRISIEVLNELAKKISYLLLPDFIHTEFLKNRNLVINTTKKQLESIKSKNIFPLAIINEPIEFENIRGQFFKQLDSLISKLGRLNKFPKEDVILKKINDIFESKKGNILKHDDSIFKKAHERSLLGKPPFSKNKKLGDEVIWETILQYSETDIIFVTRDGVHKDYLFFLKDEYKKRKDKKLILITDKIHDAFTKIGIKLPPTVIKAENVQVNDIAEKKKLIEKYIKEIMPETGSSILFFNDTFFGGMGSTGGFDITSGSST